MWGVHSGRRPFGAGAKAGAGTHAEGKVAVLTRRLFVQRSVGVGAAIATRGILGGVAGNLLAACGSATDPVKHTTIDLTTEPGVLNFVYAVLQLEADFYARVTGNVFPGMLGSEAATFSAMQNEVTASRDDIRATKIPAGRIPDVLFFRLGTAVDYSDRTDVLAHAQLIEDAAARGFLAARSLVHTSAAVTLVTSLSDAAALRSTSVRAMKGSAPLTITPQAPSDVMTILEPYYLTTFSIRT